jgi:hypothetical protein
MKPPNDPADSDQILQWAISVSACLRALWPQAGANITPSITPFGTSFLYTGRIGNGRGIHDATYELDYSESDTAHLDSWHDGAPYDESDVLIEGYDSVLWTASRLHLTYTSTTLTDSDADTINDLSLVTARLFVRDVTTDSAGNTVIVSAERLAKEWEFYAPATTTTTSEPETTTTSSTSTTTTAPP